MIDAKVMSVRSRPKQARAQMRKEKWEERMMIDAEGQRPWRRVETELKQRNIQPRHT